MIKDGLEYVLIDCKAIATGFKFKSAEQFHKCNAKIVTMERKSYELDGDPYIERMRISFTYYHQTSFTIFV